MYALLILLLLRVEQPMESGITKEMEMMAIQEGYTELKRLYKYDNTEFYRKAILGEIKLLKITCDQGNGFDLIFTALWNFETSYLNRGKDKITDILLKELGEAIKVERRKKQ